MAKTQIGIVTLHCNRARCPANVADQFDIAVGRVCRRLDERLASANIYDYQQ
jgi:hypothetical protein